MGFRYGAARIKFDADETFKQRARERVVALQSGDEQTAAVAGADLGVGEYFLTVHDRLDLTLSDKDFCGESYYNDMLPAVVEELDGLGLLRMSEGAACVFPYGFMGRDGKLPLIVRKSDGGYGYAVGATVRLDDAATLMLTKSLR